MIQLRLPFDDENIAFNDIAKVMVNSGMEPEFKRLFIDQEKQDATCAEPDEAFCAA